MNFKWTVHLLTIVILLQYLCSCNVHKRFTLYKEQPLQNLPTDGFYFQKNKSKELPLVFFLYKDGTVHTSGLFVTNATTNDPEKISAEFWYEATWKMKGEMEKHIVTIPWDQESGHYQIKNDSIKIQYFWFQTQTLVRRNVIELKGILKNDSIIYITHKRTYGAKKQNSSKLKNSTELVFDRPIMLTFHKYNDHRPDSSKVWLSKRSGIQERNKNMVRRDVQRTNVGSNGQKSMRLKILIGLLIYSGLGFSQSTTQKSSYSANVDKIDDILSSYIGCTFGPCYSWWSIALRHKDELLMQNGGHHPAGMKSRHFPIGTWKILGDTLRLAIDANSFRSEYMRTEYRIVTVYNCKILLPLDDLRNWDKFIFDLKGKFEQTSDFKEFKEYADANFSEKLIRHAFSDFLTEYMTDNKILVQRNE